MWLIHPCFYFVLGHDSISKTSFSGLAALAWVPATLAALAHASAALAALAHASVALEAPARASVALIALAQASLFISTLISFTKCEFLRIYE